jgi:hypothetical protein
MYSITIDSGIIGEMDDIEIGRLRPHEHVVLDRAEAYRAYLESLGEDMIFPAILICRESLMVIDGHHRLWALSKMNYKSVPVTYVNYMHEKILTGVAHQPQKQDLLSAALSGALLPPKTSAHKIIDYFGKAQPIILTSVLVRLRGQ